MQFASSRTPCLAPKAGVGSSNLPEGTNTLGEPYFSTARAPFPRIAPRYRLRRRRDRDVWCIKWRGTDRHTTSLAPEGRGEAGQERGRSGFAATTGKEAGVAVAGVTRREAGGLDLSGRGTHRRQL